jgi:MFS family permease
LPASLLGNELCLRYGRRPVLIAAMLVSAAVACGIGFAGAMAYGVVVALVIVYGGLVMVDSASLTAGTVGAAAPGQRGATMAVHSSIGFLGAFVGPIVFGAVLDLAGGGDSVVAWGLAFASLGIAVALGPVALWRLGRR